MTRRRIARSPRGSVGVEEYSFPSTNSDGLPNKVFSMSPQTPSSWATASATFEQAVHAKTNTITWFTPFHFSWPTSSAAAIAATGRSQIATIEPSTAHFGLVGGVRASDSGVDNPMIAGTTYNALVVSGTLLAGHIPQPSGSYVILGGMSGGPKGIKLQTSVPYTIPNGTSVPVTPFTPTKNYTIAYIFDFAGIIAGNYDTVIHTMANSAAGSNVCVRFAHEMNGNWYPWGTSLSGHGFTPAEYVSLWNAMRTAWQAAETSSSNPHLPWFWCPGISNNQGNTPAAAGILSTGSGVGSTFPLYAPTSPGAAGTGNSYYPGDSKCEFIGLDGYSNPSSHNGANPSFASLFDNDITWTRTSITTTKPFLIGETGVDASLGSSGRATWMHDLFADIENSSIRGINYFNNVGSGNYPIHTDAPTCAAMLAGLQGWVN